MSLLSAQEIESKFAELPLEWTLLGGTELGYVIDLESFAAAIDYVNKIAELAEAAQHHPDITIRYNKVDLILTTHSAGGLTEKDFELAQEIVNIKS